MKKVLLSPIWSVLLLICLTWIYTINPSLIESIRLRYFDTLIINQPVQDNNIYAINIDEDTINKYGQWPFPRENYSDIIVDLYDRGAGLVVWNVLMSEEDRFGGDADLSMTLTQVPVILTMIGTEENKNEPYNPGAGIINSDYMHLIPSISGITTNINVLETNAVGTGIADTYPEIDGVTRRAPLVFESNGILYPNVTMEVMRVIAGDPSFQIKLSPLGVDKLRIPQFGIIQTNALGEIWIDWSQGYKTASAVDLPEDLNGAVVFVGVTAGGITQPISTAKGGVWPHEMQAAMLGTTFNDSNISRHPDAKAWGELAALVVAGVLLIALSRWTYIGLGFFLLTLTGFVGGSVYGFAQYGLLIDGLTISFLLLLLGTFRYSVKFISEFLEKQAIKKQFAGYASPTVVRMLQENPSLIKDGMKKEISICFSDLRGFTPLGESFGDDVKGLTKIMNGYMDAITQPILDADGMVIKYIGDASMHVHNAPIDDPNHPHTAVQCALDMLKAVEKFNDKITAEGRPPVGMGAGINTGLGYLGEMGSTQRHSYDVLGDSVSTAARIESKCKEYGMVLLIGEATYEKTKDDFFYLKLDDLAVKGKSIGISIYTVLDDVKSNWDKFLKIHRNMLKFYRNKQFDKAIELCNILTGEFDKKMDGYYEMWIERCEYMKTQDLPEDWNGVFIATTK
jgi:adenylate cyclase